MNASHMIKIAAKTLTENNKVIRIAKLNYVRLPWFFMVIGINIV